MHSLIAAACLLGPSWQEPAPSPTASPAEIVPRDALMLPSIGRGGRTPVAIDPVQAAIVSGRFATPKAGDVVTLEGGPSRTWEPAKAGDDGTFRHPATRGGYAFLNVPSDSDRVLILDASGHGLVYAGGEPRVGDPYGHGYARVPIALRKGDNPLLFTGGRGSLRVKLVAPRAAATIDPADPTLPDLVVGQGAEAWGAVVVVNASEATLDGASLRAEVDGATQSTSIPPILPLGVRKVPFRISAPAPAGEGTRDLKLELLTRGSEGPADRATLGLSAVRPEQARKRTFPSAIDGSIQYFGLVPASAGPDDKGRNPGLILSLHGASVEGIGQARVYAPKAWAHVVAPTNRRPFGFDWEDWGRLDAIEVLDLASKELATDPSRTYLTGHSMGGHGTWHVGVTFPDRFAAIAPSAGWVSMFSYAGARRSEGDDPVAALLSRASLPSDTLSLSKNYARQGVYVLHGDADDNVPVDQARTMRKALGEFHADFAYYERPGAGHWWGNECCDWPPLIDFLSRHTLPEPKDVRRVDFLTASPGVSSRSHWATIEAQSKAFERSGVQIDCDPDARTFSGTTENVARLSIDLAHLKPGGPVAITLDGKPVDGLPDAGMAPRAWLAREGEGWKAIAEPPKALKGPHRSGPFKDAFRNRFLFVHGTAGTPEENAWALAKARYDAETFWYRGNGSVDVVSDAAFDPKAEPDRSVILFGNAESNSAWAALLGEGPVRVARGSIRVGEKAVNGDDLACLFVRPRPGSDVASVGAVSGTGPAGMRLNDRLPYFASGVAYPDLIVLGPEALAKGVGGIRGAGFFGNDWGVETGEFAWRD